MNHKLTYSGLGPMKGYEGIAWCERCGKCGQRLKEHCIPDSQTKAPGHLRGTRKGGNKMPVTDLTDKELVERAVRNAKPNIAGPSPRWVAVMDSFGLGSTYSYELCRQYGLNPDEKIDGVRCISCDP